MLFDWSFAFISESFLSFGVCISKSFEKPFDVDLVIPYLHNEHFNLIGKIFRGPEFMSLAKGNAKQAKNIREEFGKIAELL